jgi:hypothetical protein
VVESQGLEMLDDHHYTATALGHGEWARRALQVIQSKGWFPGTAIAIRMPDKPLGRRPAAGTQPFLILYADPRPGAPASFVNPLGRSQAGLIGW